MRTWFARQPGDSTRSWRSRLLWPGRQPRSWVWRLAAPVAFAAAGLLAVTSAINAQGTDLRGGRNDSLIEVVSSERAQVQNQQAQARALQEQVGALERTLSAAGSSGLQARLRALELTAGLRALSGPGLVVTLDDAPRGEHVPPGTDPNLLVVHQQDIQAVANALWAGGADGMSLQGHRIVSTTGIKCVGNTVVLQGVPYAPPYRIVAVGNVERMFRALLRSPEVRAYRDYVPPPYDLGWSVRDSGSLTVPAYTGPLSLSFARPLSP
jgi:uncharacterized protein YlxW (UPF0749 family)